jgi:hypothetical protein
MPALRVMYWNIQDLGTNRPRTRGDNLALFALITDMATRLELDVISIMEVRRTIVPQLQELRNFLNEAFNVEELGGGDWHFDWIPGAVRNEVANGTPITMANQLGWTTQAHNEGYALFWNHDRAPMLEIAPAISGGVDEIGDGGAPPERPINHALSLVLEGRRVLAARDPNGFPTATPFDTAPAAVHDWRPLDFPANFSPRVRFQGTRRPSYCYLRTQTVVDGAVADVTIPVVTYHAPSTSAIGAASGTRYCSFARQLYQAPDGGALLVRNDRVLVGGDFNVDSHTRAAYSYNGFIEGFVDGGAALPMAFEPPEDPPVPRDRRNRSIGTTVQLNLGRGRAARPILPGPGEADDDPLRYRALAIDNMFFNVSSDRSPAPLNVESRIIDLVAAVVDPAVLGGAAPGPLGTLTGDHGPIPFFLQIVEDILLQFPHLGPGGEPLLAAGGRKVYPYIHNWGDFMTGLEEGAFPNLRSAAEFVHLFLSDHLPLLISFELPTDIPMAVED